MGSAAKMSFGVGGVSQGHAAARVARLAIGASFVALLYLAGAGGRSSFVVSSSRSSAPGLRGRSSDVGGGFQAGGDARRHGSTWAGSSSAFGISVAGAAALGLGLVTCLAARRPIVGGNWKCNPKSKKDLDGLIANIQACDTSKCDVYVCPSMLHVDYCSDKFTNGVKVTPQNCNFTGCGAYTGESAVEQMQDMGITQVLIGHSERRGEFGITPMDTNASLADKLKYILDAGMSCVFCIGEPKSIREQGLDAVLSEMDKQLKLVYRMLDPKKVVIAYEPVWAIGTGLTATPEDAQATHAGIRKLISDNVSPAVADAIRIQYGGSANAKNAPALSAMPDIDGFLVGGASLKPEFKDIVDAISSTPGKSADPAPLPFYWASSSDFDFDQLEWKGLRKDADKGSPSCSSRVLYKGAKSSVGGWTCTPGGFPVVNRPTTETFYILEGEGFLTDADGTAHNFHAGDTVVLPKGWSGRWDITKTIRKIWAVHDHEENLRMPFVTQRAFVGSAQDIHWLKLGSLGKRPADWGAPEHFNKRLWKEGPTNVGAWACTAGGFLGTSNRPTTEFFYVLEGLCFLTGADGIARRVTAGDTVVLPKGWSGRWDIIEPIRKVFVIISE
eukprot:TRINITY_DN26642_c0_g2_i2.p1 TRINITY_DN26642_c0_g2~~TRINITY_DN26642_c0_g2_i2.p1  ORF type:complete len:614 (-),score=92.10 TRINITY_DN26642_c0_g2_i2:64-1905(-)